MKLLNLPWKNIEELYGKNLTIKHVFLLDVDERGIETFDYYLYIIKPHVGIVHKKQMLWLWCYKNNNYSVPHPRFDHSQPSKDSLYYLDLDDPSLKWSDGTPRKGYLHALRGDYAGIYDKMYVPCNDYKEKGIWEPCNGYGDRPHFFDSLGKKESGNKFLEIGKW